MKGIISYLKQILSIKDYSISEDETQLKEPNENVVSSKEALILEERKKYLHNRGSDKDQEGDAQEFYKEQELNGRFLVKLNVLLVDDVELNLSLGKALLEECGCTVELARGGFEAIEKYSIQTYDLVLIDINMPDLNGDEVVKRLKLKGETSAVFIGLSANGIEGERDKFIKGGLDDYISKPISLKKLSVCLDSWFSDESCQLSKSSNSHDSADFLIDLQQLIDHSDLMGGKLVFVKFIDKFIEQNNSIFAEITALHKAGSNKQVELGLALHKLIGIANSMSANGYAEVLAEAYSSVKRGVDLSDEEYSVMNITRDQVNDEFEKLKEEWEEQKEY